MLYAQYVSHSQGLAHETYLIICLALSHIILLRVQFIQLNEMEEGRAMKSSYDLFEAIDRIHV